ncbi:putative immunity protein, partial [Nocardia brasiliensis]|uniref:putative immunity protein n=1 Tax=Nocardia brasiliensis TaxID=37326 RepID=UPI00313B7CCE
MTLNRGDHTALALWAAACAELVLPLFLRARPDDARPRAAIEAARAWVRGELTMPEARRAALAAPHAAPRGEGPGEYAARTPRPAPAPAAAPG